tara:strand:- start:26 stop:244 length:219 start_codon:yes stop_codon:yes gene_type:complete
MFWYFLIISKKLYEKAKTWYDRRKETLNNEEPIYSYHVKRPYPIQIPEDDDDYEFIPLPPKISKKKVEICSF